jgi:hypothetical protein
MQVAPLSLILELASLHLELALQPYSIAWQTKIIEETTNPPEGVEQSKILASPKQTQPLHLKRHGDVLSSRLCSVNTGRLRYEERAGVLVYWIARIVMPLISY